MTRIQNPLDRCDFKQKFNALWHRAYSAIRFINGKGVEDGEGSVTLTAEDIPDVQPLLTAGENITIEDNVISASGGSAATWGSITGNIDDQTDLKNALDGKANTSDVYNKTHVDSEVQSLTEFINSVSAGVTALDNNTYKKTYIDTQLAGKQPTLTAGTNITIDANNVISATGGSITPVWGNITGTLTNQTDLKDALNDKATVASVESIEDEIGAVGQGGTIRNDISLVNDRVDSVEDEIGPETTAGTLRYKIKENSNDIVSIENEIDIIDGIIASHSTAINEKADKTYVDNELTNKADSSALTNHINNTSNPHQVSKAQVGLANVDNTSDANKPISTATQTALNKKVDRALCILTLSQSSSTISAGSDVTVPFDNAFIEGSGFFSFNSSTHVLTINKAGYYRFEYQLNMQASSTTYMRSGFVKNGGLLGFGGVNSPSTLQDTISSNRVFYCAAGDRMTFTAYSGISANIIGTGDLTVVTVTAV